MDNMDKKEKNRLYQMNNRRQIRVNVSLNEQEAFLSLCKDMNVYPTAYIKRLINADLIQRGEKPIFAEGNMRKSDEN